MKFFTCEKCDKFLNVLALMLILVSFELMLMLALIHALVILYCSI